MATDDRFDRLMSDWMEQTAPARLPERALAATFDRTRASRQQLGWRRRVANVVAGRSALALGTTAAVVLAVVVAVSPRVEPSDVGELPTTPDAWTKVSIDGPWATAGVDGLVAGPRGLLAFLGEGGSHDMQLAVSTDGRTWGLVSNDQFPSPAVLLPPQLGGRMPAVGTEEGFLFVAGGNDVWTSEDGFTWGLRVGHADDPDLREGTIRAIAVGGPGIVAVGSDNRAWYSEDGSDWTLATVPAPPTDAFLAQGLPEPTVAMRGVAVAGDTLVAWGNASADDGADGSMVEPVLWTSADGVAWTAVSDIAGIGWLQDVAAGPDGFVAIGGADRTDAGGVWFSADGRAWEPVEAEGFRDAQRTSPEVTKSSIAATSSGYVAVAGERGCAKGPCPDARVAIWSSPDGRSWSRQPDDDRFAAADPRDSGAWATTVVAWDSHFIVAGTYEASPAIWISGPTGAPEPPIPTALPSETPASEATATPTETATAAPLPAVVDAWARVTIDVGAPGGVESVVATPRGLLARGDGEGGPWLAFSVDGRTWSTVPADRIPDLSSPEYGVGGAALAGDEERFLMVGREAWSSENGIAWSRVATPADDPELGQGAVIAVAAGGPGYVAVGARNKAWYSTDGSDWALAAVPPGPGEPSGLERPLDRASAQGTVEMEGIAVSGRDLLAWGKSIWVHDDGSATFVPVFWTSTDGRSWTHQEPPDAVWDYPQVTGGPNGFLMHGEGGPIWLSAHGTSWERVAGDQFATSGAAGEVFSHPIAAGRAGYVAAGSPVPGPDDPCRLLACPPEEAVIWVSTDGRSWTRLPSDERFGGDGAEAHAGAKVVATWGDRFVIGGSYDDSPALWISE